MDELFQGVDATTERAIVLSPANAAWRGRQNGGRRVRRLQTVPEYF